MTQTMNKKPYNPKDLDDRPNQGVKLKGWIIAFVFSFGFYITAYYLFSKLF